MLAADTVVPGSGGQFVTPKQENGPMTLTEFLLARIAEDEAVARAAATRPIVTTHLASNIRREVKPDSIVVIWRIDEDAQGGSPSDRGTFREGQAHFERFDPARVLAECDAKRRIVELISSPGPQALRLLALPYATHEDYLPEWKPVT